MALHELKHILYLSFSPLVRLFLPTGFIVTLSQACFHNADLG